MVGTVSAGVVCQPALSMTMTPWAPGATVRHAGFELEDVSGMSYRPLADEWTITRDLDVNYLTFAAKG